MLFVPKLNRKKKKIGDNKFTIHIKRKKRAPRDSIAVNTVHNSSEWIYFFLFRVFFFWRKNQ